jgi:hypothetical protein
MDQRGAGQEASRLIITPFEQLRQEACTSYSAFHLIVLDILYR